MTTLKHMTENPPCLFKLEEERKTTRQTKLVIGGGDKGCLPAGGAACSPGVAGLAE